MRVAKPVAPLVAASEESASLPFSVKVIHEVNDGSSVHITGEVLPKPDAKISGAVLVLTILKAGEVISEKALPLNSLTASEPGAALPFAISNVSGASTDYQLQLLWGAEAFHYLSAASQPESDSGTDLVIDNVRLESVPCQEDSCKEPVSHIVRAELQNNTAKIVESVELGLGFAWVPRGSLDFPKVNPQNEEKLSLKALGLKPNVCRSLSLSIAAAVPQRKDAELKPVLRVISYSG